MRGRRGRGPHSHRTMSALSPILDGIYDIIVIGGGTAGLVIANRLSQDSNTRVLVLEGGPHHTQDPKVDNPGLASTTWGDPHYDYNFSTNPQVGHVIKPRCSCNLGHKSLHVQADRLKQSVNWRQFGY